MHKGHVVGGRGSPVENHRGHLGQELTTGLEVGVDTSRYSGHSRIGAATIPRESPTIYLIKWSLESYSPASSGLQGHLQWPLLQSLCDWLYKFLCSDIAVVLCSPSIEYLDLPKIAAVSDYCIFQLLFHSLRQQKSLVPALRIL